MLLAGERVRGGLGERGEALGRVGVAVLRGLGRSARGGGRAVTRGTGAGGRESGRRTLVYHLVAAAMSFGPPTPTSM